MQGWTAEGATGEVSYWNGDSGWIKQTGIEHEPTSHGQDVMLLSRFLPQEGVNIQLGTKLTFDIAADGTARNIRLQQDATEPPWQPGDGRPPGVGGGPPDGVGPNSPDI